MDKSRINGNIILGDSIELPKKSSFKRYGFVIAIVISILLITDEVGLNRTPYLLPLFGVLISSLYGGLGPGIWTTILLSVGTVFFFTSQTYHTYFNHLIFVQSTLFIVESIITALLIENVKKDKEDIYRKSEWFYTTLTSIGDAVISTDTELRITYMNPVAEKITGWKLWEARGYRLSDVFRITNEKTGRKVTNPAKTVIKKGIVSVLANHTTLISRDKRKIPIDDSAAPIRDRNGKLIGVILIFRDITEKRELEKRKDDFISTASHELKTPLTTIKAFVQILKNKFSRKPDQETGYMISRIDDQVKRLTGLVNELLDITKIQNGKMELNKEKINMDDLISETVKDSLIYSPKFSITIGNNSEATVHADKFRMCQVLHNLISNAMKYSADSKKILIESAVRKGDLTVSVKDWGIGIPKSERKKIFDRFYRVNKTNGLGNSTSLGMGLFIAREIVERHGGKIWLESESGKGSTFYFSVPVSGNIQ